jgi:hypothetical protein
MVAVICILVDVALNLSLLGRGKGTHCWNEPKAVRRNAGVTMPGSHPCIGTRVVALGQHPHVWIPGS